MKWNLSVIFLTYIEDVLKIERLTGTWIPREGAGYRSEAEEIKGSLWRSAGHNDFGCDLSWIHSSNGLILECMLAEVNGGESRGIEGKMMNAERNNQPVWQLDFTYLSVPGTQ